MSSLIEGPTTTVKVEKVSLLSAPVTLMAVIFLPRQKRKREEKGDERALLCTTQSGVWILL